MARIRSIKPEFWQDERLGRVSRDARLLFLGMLNLADDFGILRGNPKLIKGHVFPFDDVDAAALLDELERIGRVIRYHANEEELVLIKNFTKHQKIDRREKQRFPLPTGFEVIEVPAVDAKGKPCLARQVVEIARTDDSRRFPAEPARERGEPARSPGDSPVGREGNRDQGTGNREVDASAADVQAFLDWTKMKRPQELGATVPDDKQPTKVGRESLSDALQKHGRQKLEVAYLAFLGDRYWLGRDPPCPIHGFIDASQLPDYLSAAERFLGTQRGAA